MCCSDKEEIAVYFPKYDFEDLKDMYMIPVGTCLKTHNPVCGGEAAVVSKPY